MRKLLVSSFLIFAISAGAQEPLGLKSPVVSMKPAPVFTVTQGKPGTASLTFHVTNGYHINSNRPRSEFLIPTSLKVSADTDIVIGGVSYPEGEDMSFAFAPDDKLNVYTRDFKVGVIIRPLRGAQSGKYMLRGSLKYQACDNAACYPPKQLPINFEVRIAKAPPAARKNPAQSPHSHR